MPDTHAVDTPVETLHASDVMSTTLLTVSPDESVLMAYELMSRANVHHLPVVSPHGHCLGLLDARTLMQEWYPAPLARQRRPVSALVGQRQPSVRPDDTLREVAEQMDVNEVDALPVVDEHGRLLGLVTSRDIVAAVGGRRRGEDRVTSAGPVLFTMEPVLPDPSTPPP